jgi:cyclohexa-1,5-dienecarbonyl-CoA hydratase
MLGTVHEMFRIVHGLPMPTVCAIDGVALGGGLELAIACDCILASDRAQFAFPEIKLGVFPPLAVAYLHHVIGEKLAAEMVLTGEKISAHRAHAIGLINQVFPVESFAASVDAFLARFQSLSAFALRQTKAAMRRAAGDTFARALAESERVYLKDLMSGKDPDEGIRAFMEKRGPRWRHQ